MKGWKVLVLLAVVVAAVVAALMFLVEDPQPQTPAPTGVAPVVGTTVAPREPVAVAQPHRRARAADAWVELGPGTVAGTVVVYGSEKPIADAEVTLTAGEAGPNRTLTTRTAADGSFRIQNAPNFDDWTLRVAVAPPLAPLEQSGVAVIENETTNLGILYVTPAFEVPGVVVDEQGEPVAGAEVRVLRIRGNAAQMDLLRLIRELPQDIPAVDRATSGKDGRFRLTKTTPGSYDFKVVAAGRQVLVERQLVVTPESAKRDLRFVVAKGFSLAGRLARSGPGPVARVTVVAFRQPKSELELLALDRTYTTTDDDGKFALEGLAGGEYVVAATPPGEPYCVRDRVPVPETQWLELLIAGESSLEGRVLGKEEKPVAGAQVYVIDLQDGRPMVANTRTDADGRYSIGGLRAGRVQMFLVEAEGYATWPKDLISAFRGGGAESFDLVPGKNVKDVSLLPGATVRGVVVSKDDETPIEGARVELGTVLAFFGGTRSTLTDSQGRFELTSVPMGASAVIVSKDGWFQPGASTESIAMAFQNGGKAKDTGRGLILSVTEPGEVIERTLTLARGSTVSGQVVAPDGSPVAGARVDLRKAAEGDGFFGRLEKVLGTSDPRMTDAEGRFEMPGPRPGVKMLVVANAQGWLEGVSEPLLAGVGQRIDGLRIALRTGAGIEGRVTSTSGLPVEGALVRWMKTDDMQEWEVRWRIDDAPSVATDAEGRYRVEHVEPGKVLVRVTHGKHLAQNFEDFAVADGAAAHLDVKLEAGGAIAGRVLDTQGKPKSGATVTFTPASGNADERDRFGDSERSVTTVADGSFNAEGLALGGYMVRASAAGYASSEEVAASTGGTPLTLRLAPSLRITGFARVGGAPAKGVRVNLFVAATGAEVPGTQGDRRVSDAITGTDGSFTFDDLKAGTYDLAFAASNWGREDRSNVLSKRVPAVAAGAADVLVDLDAGLSIAGTVKLEDGTPADRGWVHASQLAADGTPVVNGIAQWAGIDEGRFDLRGLAQGSYAVQVNVEGRGQRSVTADAGTHDVRIVLGAVGRITGLVQRADGTPASGVWVNASDGQRNQSAGTDAQGRYTLAIDPGTYTVHAGTWGEEPSQRTSGNTTGVVVRRDDTTEAPTITLRAVEVPK